MKDKMSRILMYLGNSSINGFFMPRSCEVSINGSFNQCKNASCIFYIYYQCKLLVPISIIHSVEAVLKIIIIIKIMFYHENKEIYLYSTLKIW